MCSIDAVCAIVCEYYKSFHRQMMSSVKLHSLQETATSFGLQRRQVSAKPDNQDRVLFWEQEETQTGQQEVS